jgi:hypothetical protein
VGVAVAVARTTLGTHAGIIFDDHSAKQLLHLRFHYDLMVEDVPIEYAWREVKIPPQLASIVSSICRGVVRQYYPDKLAFGIDFIASFDASGTVKNYAFGTGFTCATMVLGIFQGASIELVDKADWYLRYGDLKWQWTIVGALAKNRRHISLQYLMSQILAIGCFRFRPEDVVAAAVMSDTAPNGLPSLVQLSNQIRDEINNLPRID